MVLLAATLVILFSRSRERALHKNSKKNADDVIGSSFLTVFTLCIRSLIFSKIIQSSEQKTTTKQPQNQNQPWAERR